MNNNKELSNERRDYIVMMHESLLNKSKVVSEIVAALMKQLDNECMLKNSDRNTAMVEIKKFECACCSFGK